MESILSLLKSIKFSCFLLQLNRPNTLSHISSRKNTPPHPIPPPHPPSPPKHTHAHTLRIEMLECIMYKILHNYKSMHKTFWLARNTLAVSGREMQHKLINQTFWSVRKNDNHISNNVCSSVLFTRRNHFPHVV